MALRWSWIDNEDYGRSYVEEYLGDLVSAEGLAKAITEAAAAAAKVVILVRPNGVTREDDVTSAENLDVISGIEDDVKVLQLQKHADMRVAQAVLNDIIQRLSYAFLMNTAVQRDAERVTAEEIRYMIGELEDALGGTYALFSQERSGHSKLCCDTLCAKRGEKPNSINAPQRFLCPLHRNLLKIIDFLA